MSTDKLSPDTSALTVLAEQARQMHEDLLSLLCAGSLGNPSKLGLGWELKVYGSLLTRAKGVLGAGAALDHLTQQSEPGSTVEVCLALGQVAATLRVFCDEVESGQAGRIGFRP